MSAQVPIGVHRDEVTLSAKRPGPPSIKGPPIKDKCIRGHDLLRWRNANGKLQAGGCGDCKKVWSRDQVTVGRVGTFRKHTLEGLAIKHPEDYKRILISVVMTGDTKMKLSSVRKLALERLAVEHEDEFNQILSESLAGR